MGNKTDKVEIRPEVVDFIALDLAMDPQHLSETVWPSLLEDPDILPLLHGALVYASTKYRGFDESNISKAESFREGIAFAAETFRQTLQAVRADRELNRILKGEAA